MPERSTPTPTRRPQTKNPAAAIPSSLRRMNRRMILRHMIQAAAASRGELAEVAGTSAVTVGKIVDELLEQGVLEPVAGKRDALKPGRPGQGLRLNTREPRFLVIQVGIAHTRLGFVALGATEENGWSAGFDTPAGAPEWKAALQTALDTLKPAGIWGTLICLPGILDEEAGKVLYSPNLHWSEAVDFRATVQGMVNTPVELVHEIRALALGHLSATPADTDFLLVDFGHGVGGAAVVRGGLYQSTLPMAGELGHSIVAGNDRTCGCGSKGCLETLLSRRGLYASIQEQNPKKSQLAKYSWPAVQKYIADNGLEPWLQKSLQAAGANIASAMNVLGLGSVVITGSVSDFPEKVRDFLAGEIRRDVLWGKFGDVHVRFAPRRRMRGLISVGIDRLLVDSAAD